SAVGGLRTQQLRDARRELLRCERRRVSVDDPALRADNLAQRPVDDVRAVRQTAAAPEVRRARACSDLLFEGREQARLADARLADDGNEVRAAPALDAREQLAQLGELGRAADQRRARRLSALIRSRV